MSAPASPPLRGLLVDWGGVMASAVFPSLSRICEGEGLEPRVLSELLRESAQARELLIGLEEGRIGERCFERRLGSLVGLEHADGLIERIFSGVSLDQEMVAAIRCAHEAGVLTGVISNSWGTSHYPRELLREIFDGVVISAELGVRKPDRRIYEAGARAIGCEAAECVFVDDLAFNLDAARELGMRVIHHLDADSTIGELEGLFGLRLRADVSRRT